VEPVGEQQRVGTTLNARHDFAPEPGASPDVFYTFELDRPTFLELVLESTTPWFSAPFIFGGSCAAPVLVELRDEDGSAVRARLVTYSPLPAGRYYIVVTGLTDFDEGPFLLTLTFEEYDPCGDGVCDEAGGETAASCPADCDPCLQALPAGPGTLVINEILLDPSSHDVNADGVASSRQDEFIEIVNVAGQPVRLEWIMIETDIGGEELVVHIIDGGCLPARQGIVLFSGGAIGLPEIPGTTFLISDDPLGLNNTGDTVALLNRSSTVLDRVWGAVQSAPARSLTRIPDGTGPFGDHPWIGPGEPRGCSADLGCPPLFSPGTCANGEPFATCLP